MIHQVAVKGLSFNAKKALMVNIGENAGTELAELIGEMAQEIEMLRRNKVEVIRIAPSPVGQPKRGLRGA